MLYLNAKSLVDEEESMILDNYLSELLVVRGRFAAGLEFSFGNTESNLPMF